MRSRRERERRIWRSPLLLIPPVALAGCIHAPNLEIQDAKLLSRRTDQISYSVRVVNSKKRPFFSRCRTGPARGEIVISATLSANQQPGSVLAGRQPIVSQTQYGLQRELNAGKTRQETVEYGVASDPKATPYLVIELKSNEAPNRCAVLSARSALPLAADGFLSP